MKLEAKIVFVGKGSVGCWNPTLGNILLTAKGSPAAFAAAAGMKRGDDVTIVLAEAPVTFVTASALAKA